MPTSKVIKRRIFQPERLEARNLLAGDFAPGDANQDYFFDDSDFVLAMSGLKYEQGTEATWEQGDWSGDNRFNSHDFVAAFQSDNYQKGRYDRRGQRPETGLSPLVPESDESTHAIQMYIERGTGSVQVVGQGITTVQIHSRRGRLRIGQTTGLFDVSSQNKMFVLMPGGAPAFQFTGLLGPDVSETFALEDLTIDGSFDEGRFGDVSMEFVDSISAVANEIRIVSGFVAGDSNRDYYFDEADFVLSMKSGNYETDKRATWSQGDWNNDTRFNSSDFVAAFAEGFYRRGTSMASLAGEPIHTAAPFSISGTPNTIFYYDTETGRIVVQDAQGAALTTLNIRSRSESLRINRSNGLFDVSTPQSYFELLPNGKSNWVIDQVIPAGLTLDALRDDLLIDGSKKSGVGLGTVHLTSIANLPLDVPDNPPPGNQPPPISADGIWYDVDQANILFTYDPVYGDLSVDAIRDTVITTLEVQSPSPIFAHPEAIEIQQQLFDVRTFTKFFMLRPDGFSSIELNGTMQTGLTAAQFKDTAVVRGSRLAGGEIKPAFVMARKPAQDVADVNGDYFLDEADLLSMLKAGKFNEPVNAVWTEGDANLDFRFDDQDLKLLAESTAFRAGAYSELANDSQHQRQSLSEDNNGDIVLQYDVRSGDLSIASQFGELIAVHLTSDSQLFSVAPTELIVDQSTESSYFQIVPQGASQLSISGLLPPNLTVDEIRADLQIDGALKGGGGFDTVTISNSQIPLDFAPGDANKDYRVDAADLIQIMQRGHFDRGDGAVWEDGDFNGDGQANTADLQLVQQFDQFSATGRPYTATDREAKHDLRPFSGDREDVTLVYLPMTGALVVFSDDELTSLHVRSLNENLVPTGMQGGDFDIDNARDFFAFNPRGIGVEEVLIRLPRFMDRTEILHDITVTGSRMDGQPFSLTALNVLIPVDIEAHCVELVASGFIIGDANMDGIFDSKDIVQVFQEGEYEDGIRGNSTWYDGDWNCDNEFNSEDIIDAFKGGGFTFAANVRRAAAAVHHIASMEMKLKEDLEKAPRFNRDPRELGLHIQNGDWKIADQPIVLAAAAFDPDQPIQAEPLPEHLDQRVNNPRPNRGLFLP